MRTVKLNTGVEITFDEKDNMVNLTTPYSKSDPVKKTTLRWYVKLIKQMIK